MTFEDASAEASLECCTTNFHFAGLKEFLFRSKSRRDTIYVLHTSSFRNFIRTSLNLALRTERGFTGIGSSIRDDIFLRLNDCI